MHHKNQIRVTYSFKAIHLSLFNKRPASTIIAFGCEAISLLFYNNSKLTALVFFASDKQNVKNVTLDVLNLRLIGGNV